MTHVKHLATTFHKELSTSFFDYLILFAATLAMLVFLRLYQGERIASFLILMSFSSFYILWGIFHHLNEKTLHIKNVIEYIFIGFTILILLTILFS